MNNNMKQIFEDHNTIIALTDDILQLSRVNYNLQMEIMRIKDRLQEMENDLYEEYIDSKND